MDNNRTPKWLQFLERRLRWLGIPNIAILIVTLQALGFLLVSTDPIWLERLALIPKRVVEQQEYWRLITFLALPLTFNFFWLIIALWFLYFILNAIESTWGEFKTTFYVLVSIILTVGVSFLIDYPIINVTDFENTLFLAGASLYPEMEILAFFVVPVKLKWLGWISVFFLFFRFIGASWTGRIYLLAIYGNYLIFFGPAMFERIRQYFRKRNFRKKLR